VKIHIEFDPSPRLRRALAAGAAASVLFLGGAVAYAQSAATTNDTLIGSALNTLGNAVALLQAQVAQLQAADHVDRATIAASGAVVAQNGAWLGRVAHPSTGSYVLAFATGAFSTPPTCVLSAIASDAVVPGISGAAPLAPALSCSHATPSSVACQSRAGIIAVDTEISAICVGQ